MHPLIFTPAAITHLQGVRLTTDPPTAGLRVYVQGGGCSGFQYGLMWETSPTEMDYIQQVDTLPVYLDPVSMSYLHGAIIDFVESITGGGLHIQNPHATTTCGCGSSFGV